MSADWKNKLYFGDNLDILREHVADESVDLIYLDPPFNSKATYNVLYQEKNGTDSAAQIKAFDDTWHWDMSTEAAYQEVVTGGGKIAVLLDALRQFLGSNDMMAYLVMMAIRLIELHGVLKPTGSIYLHCDPTASHYLKLLMDGVFSEKNFLNEVTWQRFKFHADAHRWGRLHDVLLVYAKDASAVEFETQRRPYNKAYIKSHFKRDEDGRLYRLDNALAQGAGPARRFFGKAIEPRPGTHWRWSQENIDRLSTEGRIVLTSKGWPTAKRYLDEMPGHPVGDVWTDIAEINSQARERLGYPTQKPEALLERIIKAGSNEGDLVLDPFCGCGTTVAVAERLHRRWIGIDITHLAIGLMRHRLNDTFGPELSSYEVIGDPKDVPGANALFDQDPFQFEWWALGLVEARGEQKMGPDKGVDGRIFFFDDDSGKAKKVVVQVKGGHVGSPQVSQLKGAMEAEEAEIGAFITLQEPTRPMREAAAVAGFYDPPGLLPKVPRLQILTIEELLAGKKLDYPKHQVETFRKAPRQFKGKRQSSTPESQGDI